MKVLARNKKALFNYEPLKHYEAGIVLQGWEVKSIKAGNVSLKESYITLKDGEPWLVGAHVSKWPGMKEATGVETRHRKLLLNKGELKKLLEGKSIKGNTIVIINFHLSNKRIKAQIAIARGKKQYDKRQKLREKDMKRQIERDLRSI